jgi:Protein of unknown function (DUF5672)
VSTSQLTYKKLENFFSDYGIQSKKIENPATLFRYICYENINLIRQVPLPEVKQNQPLESVIIDNRNFPHIEFVIRNTILKLGPGWSHTVVCTSSNLELIQEMCSKISDGIRIIQIQEKWRDVNFFNELMYDVDFWRLLNGDRILIYQDDTIIFRENISDFLSYDYIGAPWKHKPYGLDYGNGGFSLRNRKMIIDILDSWLLVNRHIEYLSSQDYGHISGSKMLKPAEDLFFSLAFRNKSKAMPSASVASAFSTEHFPNPDSLGGHQFWLFDPHWVDRMLKLLDGLKPTDPEKVS